MRRLLHLQERQEAAQTPRGAKWSAAQSLRLVVDDIYRDVSALARAVKANDESAADGAASDFLSKWAHLTKQKEALERAFPPVELGRSAA